MNVTLSSKEDRKCHPFIKHPRKMSFTDRDLDSMLLIMENLFSIWIHNQNTCYPTKNNCLSHNEALNTKKQRKQHPVSGFKNYIRAVR